MPYDVWFHVGTNGSGTQADPFDGGTFEHFDQHMRELADEPMPQPHHIHLAAGTYKTLGIRHFADSSPHEAGINKFGNLGWNVRSNWTISGAGESNTIIQLERWPTFEFPPHPQTIPPTPPPYPAKRLNNDKWIVVGSWYDDLASNVIIENLTGDGNWENLKVNLDPPNDVPPPSVALHAIAVITNGPVTYRNVTIIGFYGYAATGYECFALCACAGIGSMDQAQNSPTALSVFDHCTVHGGFGDYSVGIAAFGGGPAIIDHCHIYSLANKYSGAIQAIGQDIQITNNLVRDCIVPFYVDTGNIINLLIEGNHFVSTGAFVINTNSSLGSVIIVVRKDDEDGSFDGVYMDVPIRPSSADSPHYRVRLYFQCTNLPAGTSNIDPGDPCDPSGSVCGIRIPCPYEKGATKGGLEGTGAYAPYNGAIYNGLDKYFARPLLPRGSTWRYLADGTDQGQLWRGVGFNDSAWPSGPAELGYGDAMDGRPEATNIRPDLATPIYATYYFRAHFTAPSAPGDLAFVTNIRGRILRDDAAAVYLNGTQVFRDEKLPAGALYSDFSSVETSEREYTEFAIPVSAIVPGDNTVAIEVHQFSSMGTTSTDLSFDFEIVADNLPGAPRRFISYSRFSGAARLDAVPETIVLFTTPGTGTYTLTGSATPLGTFTATADSELLTRFTGALPADGNVVTIGNLGGTLPVPLVAGTQYVVRQVSGSTFKLAWGGQRIRHSAGAPSVLDTSKVYIQSGWIWTNWKIRNNYLELPFYNPNSTPPPSFPTPGFQALISLTGNGSTDFDYHIEGNVGRFTGTYRGIEAFSLVMDGIERVTALNNAFDQRAGQYGKVQIIEAGSTQANLIAPDVLQKFGNRNLSQKPVRALLDDLHQSGAQQTPGGANGIPLPGTIRFAAQGSRTIAAAGLDFRNELRPGDLLSTDIAGHLGTLNGPFYVTSIASDGTQATLSRAGADGTTQYTVRRYRGPASYATAAGLPAFNVMNDGSMAIGGHPG